MYHDTGFKAVSPGWRIWGGEGKTEGGEGGAVECNGSGLGRKSGFLTRTWLEVTSGCFAVQKGSLHMHLQDHVLQTVTANSRDLSAPCTPPALQRYLPPSSPQVEVHGAGGTVTYQCCCWHRSTMASQQHDARWASSCKDHAMELCAFIPPGVKPPSFQSLVLLNTRVFSLVYSHSP